MSPLPSVLYHYTTQQGLLGILESGCLWATKAYHLNDTSEVRLAVDLARETLADLDRSLSVEWQQRNSQLLQSLLRGQSRARICVASLSKKPDQLSQWRAYGSGMAGYSIGFNTDRILKSAAELSLEVAECIYREAEQQELIEQLMRDFVFREINSDLIHFCPDFENAFSRLAAKLKHQAFYEEEEVRLIATQVNKLYFREGRHSLIPYAKLALNLTANDSIVSIHIGPTTNPQAAWDATHDLLLDRKLAGRVRLLSSAAPFQA